jgi:ribosomal protein L21E
LTPRTTTLERTAFDLEISLDEKESQLKEAIEKIKIGLEVMIRIGPSSSKSYSSKDLTNKVGSVLVLIFSLLNVNFFD